ncbi:uncharacterized protein H6S33_008640 [Morchella sextelata]|uniref:uncharacterized protein n=1 Tax=Morchella sextelata TaxID=1174677 RepID=UPI001D04E4E1|nr:uncharacterized protein H6S33_008640 [Morchella sextelata]KAH0602559.1 hypothetical protein H6S33_008640 [Morchella sextelata]
MNIIKRFSIILLLVLLSLTINVRAYKQFNEPIGNRMICESSNGSPRTSGITRIAQLLMDGTKSAMVVSTGLGALAAQFATPRDG